MVQRLRTRHPYLIAVAGVWLVVNVLHVQATMNWFNTFSDRGEHLTAYVSAGVRVLLPFELPTVSSSVGLNLLIELLLAVAFVGFVKWQVDDASLRAGWKASALFVLLFALLSPQTLILYGVNDGIQGVLAHLADHRIFLLAHYGVLVALANVFTAAILPLRLGKRGPLVASPGDQLEG